MKLQRQTKGQCMLYAYAMVLNVEPVELTKFIGHDGLVVAFSGAYPYRGFHPQEMMEYCLSKSRHLIIVEAIPNTEGPNGEIVLLWDQTFCKERLHKYLNEYDCVIITERHAVAWNHIERKIYDPNGFIIDLPVDYSVRELHLIL